MFTGIIATIHLDNELRRKTPHNIEDVSLRVTTLRNHPLHRHTKIKITDIILHFYRKNNLITQPRLRSR